MKKIAILMAAFNGEKWISEQLESILSQTEVIIDLYVSLDLSTDKTLDILKSFRSQHNNLFLLSYGKKFGGAAKNFYRLIKEVNFKGYDYVAFADQDDVWCSSRLSRGIKCIDSSKSKAYSSDVTAFWPNGSKKLLIKSQPQKKFDYMFESAGPGCTYIFEAETFLEFKSFVDINWNKVQKVEFHDWLAYSFYRSRGHKWYIDNQSNVLYRQHERNQFGANASFKAIFTRLNLIRNSWYKNQIKIISELNNFPTINRKFILKNFMQTRRKKIHALSMLFVCMFFESFNID